jgi:hypothetical protein
MRFVLIKKIKSPIPHIGTNVSYHTRTNFLTKKSTIA